MNYEVGSRYPHPGDKVRVVEKKNYENGLLTEGVVKDVLTSKQFHPRGHKVRLKSGIIGRVQEFVEDKSQEVKTSSQVTPGIPYVPDEDELV